MPVTCHAVNRTESADYKSSRRSSHRLSATCIRGSLRGLALLVLEKYNDSHFTDEEMKAQ